MEEHDDLSVGNSDNSEVRVKGYVRRRDETPIVNMDFEDQVEVGPGVDEVGGDCNNGDDVMVEVMGSDVFVDGVCSSGSGGSSDNEEVEAGSGGEDKFGESGVVEFIESTTITETEVVQEEIMVVEREELVEKELVKGEERVQKVVEDEGVNNGDTSAQEVGITVNEVLNHGNETVVRESSEVVVITHVETSVVVEEKAMVIVETNTDDGLDEKMSQKAGASHDEVPNSGSKADIVPLATIHVESSCVEDHIEASLTTNSEVVADKVAEKTQNDISACADVESLYEQTPISSYEVSEMHSYVVVDPKLEDRKAEDSSNRNPVCSDYNDQNMQIKDTGNEAVTLDILPTMGDDVEVNVVEASNDVEMPQGNDLQCTLESEACDAETVDAIDEVANQDQDIGIGNHVLDNDPSIDHRPLISVVSHEEENIVEATIDSEQNDLEAGEKMEEEEEENGTDITQSKAIDEEKNTKMLLVKCADSTGVPQVGEHEHEPLPSNKENLKTLNSSTQKRKHDFKEITYPKKKERNVSGPIDSTVDSSFDDDDDSLVQDKRVIILPTQVSRPSFKIGDCISRVASQMTGSPSIRKTNGEIFHKVDLINHGSDRPTMDSSGRKLMIPTVYSPAQEMLPQLHLLAQDPSTGHNFTTTIVNFFSGFRNSVIPGQYSRAGNNLSVNKVGSGKKRKGQHFPETFEFEDMKDSYWTDRVIQNGSEEKPLCENQQNHQLVALESEQVTSRSYSRKKSNYSNKKPTEPMRSNNEKIPDLSPTELVLNFPGTDPVPSEAKLTRMFKRFGSLKESETEVDRQMNRGRVVFKKCSDAEVAFSSSQKFNIFGQIPVNYELNYSPTVPFKSPCIETATQDLEDAIAQDMEIAATEYLEDANVQFLEDVSIHYLEDGTGQYIEDASMQFLEVTMAENHEDDGSHNPDASSTQYLVEHDTDVQTMIQVEVQNPEKEDTAFQTMIEVEDQKLEEDNTTVHTMTEVEVQNLEKDNAAVQTMLEVEDQNLEKDDTAVQTMIGEEVQNLEEDNTAVETMIEVEDQNLEEGELNQNVGVAAEQNLDDATTENFVVTTEDQGVAATTIDATTQVMEDAMAQHEIKVVIVTDYTEDASTIQAIENTNSQKIEDASSQEMEDSKAIEQNNVTTQDLEDATMVNTQEMEDTIVEEVKDITAHDMEDETTEAIDDIIAEKMNDSTAQEEVNDATTQKIEDGLAQHSEEAKPQHNETC